MLKPVIALIAILAPPAIAQSASDARTIDALLTEVRQLREAIERSTLLNARVQLAVQRLALQDQRVARLSSQLDTVRREIGVQANDINRSKEQIPIVEQQISSESDASRRKSLEDLLLHVKANAGKVVDPQLLARESEVVNALQYERSVAQEVADRIATIERALEPPRPAK